jgi:hypothetical protein
MRGLITDISEPPGTSQPPHSSIKSPSPGYAKASGSSPVAVKITRLHHLFHRSGMLIQTRQSLHCTFLHPCLQVSVANFA